MVIGRESVGARLQAGPEGDRLRPEVATETRQRSSSAACDSCEARDRAGAALRRTRLFADMPPEQLSGLAHAARHGTFARGSTIVGASEDPHVLVVVAEGTAHVFRVSAEGRELILLELHQGDVFGLTLLGVASDGGNMLRAASREVSAYFMHEETIETALAGDASLCLRALHLVSDGALALCAQTESLAFEPMRVRLAHTLSMLAREEGDRLAVYRTCDELALWVGSRREEVSRVLSQLVRAGLIRKTSCRQGIEIIDRQALAAYR